MNRGVSAPVAPKKGVRTVHCDREYVMLLEKNIKNDPTPQPWACYM